MASVKSSFNVHMPRAAMKVKPSKPVHKSVSRSKAAHFVPSTMPRAGFPHGGTKK